VIEAEVAAATLSGKPPRVRPAADPRMARLRGTVALVLQKHFGAFPSSSTAGEGAQQPRARSKALARG